MLKIRYVSDLHLEFGKFTFKNTCKDTVLVLAGDIGVGGLAMSFIQKNAPKWKAIIYVSGNHEYYNQVMSEHEAKWQDRAATFDNVFYLQNDAVVIDNVKFIGTTLWTDLNKGDFNTVHKAKMYMNDYKMIKTSKAPGYSYSSRVNDKYLTPYDTMNLNFESVEFLKKELDTNMKVVVVTHHAPTSAMIDLSRYGHQELLNAAYYSSLEYLIDEFEPAFWISGHTHAARQEWVYETLCVSNCRGYAGYELVEGFNEDAEIIVT
jgi:Icc-related predicted phosphoesterase